MCASTPFAVKNRVHPNADSFVYNFYMHVRYRSHRRVHRLVHRLGHRLVRRLVRRLVTPEKAGTTGAKISAFGERLAC